MYLCEIKWKNRHKLLTTLSELFNFSNVIWGNSSSGDNRVQIKHVSFAKKRLPFPWVAVVTVATSVRMDSVQ